MPTFSGIVVATGVEASGRRTMLDVVDELARPIDASDTTIRALAGDAFRAAVRRVNIKGCWPWEAMDEDVAIMANVKFSSVASAIKKPLAMHYTNGSGGEAIRKIGYIAYDRLVESYDLNITGTAYYYTIPNMFETGQIRWFPIPSAADTARFTFYRVTPAPRTEDEAIEIPDHALEAYMAVAWAEFMKRLPNGQRTMSISEAEGMARVAFRELSAHIASAGDRSREVPR